MKKFFLRYIIKMETFSVTIRPRANNFKIRWIDDIRDYLDTKKPNVKYVIGGESGSDSEINHIQLALVIKSRSDNIRRMIKTVIKFEPEDDFEARQWCKISKSDDPNYTKGYCVKEQKLVESNYTIDEVEAFHAYYKEKKTAEKHNGGWECKGINELPYFLMEYCEKLNKGLIKTMVFSEQMSMRALAYHAFGQGLLPFSLVRKLKRSDEIIFRQLIRSASYNRLVKEIDLEDRE